MTDREKAEEALVKAGFEECVTPDGWWTRDSYPGVPDKMVDRVEIIPHWASPGEYFRLIGEVGILPSLLSPTLTEEERKALEWAIRVAERDTPNFSAWLIDKFSGLLARFGGGQA